MENYENFLTLRRNTVQQIIKDEDYNGELEHIDFMTIQAGDLEDDELDVLFHLLSEDLGEEIVGMSLRRDNCGYEEFVLQIAEESEEEESEEESE